MSQPKAKITIPSPLKQCTYKDDARYELGGAMFTPNADDCGFLSATDCRIAVVVEAQGESEREVFVPADVLQYDGRKNHRYVVELKDRWTGESYYKSRPSGQKVAVANPLEIHFPKVEDVLQEVGDDVLAQITIDQALLARIGEALTNKDDRRLTLFITGSHNPVVIKGAMGIGAIAPFSDDNSNSSHERERYNDFAKRFRSARKAASSQTPDKKED